MSAGEDKAARGSGRHPRGLHVTPLSAGPAWGRWAGHGGAEQLSPEKIKDVSVNMLETGMMPFRCVLPSAA